MAIAIPVVVSDIGGWSGTAIRSQPSDNTVNRDVRAAAARSQSRARRFPGAE